MPCKDERKPNKTSWLIAWFAAILNVLMVHGDPTAVKWVVYDGLLPLLGAAALFLLWGCIRYIASDQTKHFKHSWKEAFDPMGWLYGATILAIQSGTKAASTGNNPLKDCLYICAGVCLLLLLAAMTSRGENPEWKPRRSFQAMVIAFICAILAAGYFAHSTASNRYVAPAAVNGAARSD